MEEKLELGLFHYKLLFTINEKINLIQNETDLFDTILNILKSNINNDIGIFFKVEKTKIKPISSIGIDLSSLSFLDFNIKKDLIGYACENLIPLKIDNLSEDKRFLHINSVLRGIGIKAKSFLIVPIIYKKEILGLIKLINLEKKFNIFDLQVLTIISRDISVKLKNEELHNKKECEINFSNYIVQHLNSGIIVLNNEYKINLINPKAKQILNIKDEPIEELKNTYPQLYEKIKELFISKKTLSREYIKIDQKTLGFSTVYIEDKNLSINGIIFLFQDITQYQKT